MSQQNRVVERKHRHLVETGLALLAHSSLPLHFWDEGIPDRMLSYQLYVYTCSS
jgi:hypothetical protein